MLSLLRVFLVLLLAKSSLLYTSQILESGMTILNIRILTYWGIDSLLQWYLTFKGTFLLLHLECHFTSFMWPTASLLVGWNLDLQKNCFCIEFPLHISQVITLLSPLVKNTIFFPITDTFLLPIMQYSCCPQEAKSTT